MTKEELQAKLHAEVAELKAKLAAARVKLGNRAEEFLGDVDVKLAELDKVVDESLDDFAEEVAEEVAEFKAVGPVAWVKSNPMTALGLVVGFGAAVNGVLAVFGMHFGL